MLSVVDSMRSLHYNEDKELGLRFTKNGFHMIGDSNAKIFSLKTKTTSFFAYGKIF